MFKVLLTLICLGMLGGLHAADKPFGERSLMSQSSIAERVERTGAVCLEGESCAGAVLAADAEDEAAAPTVAAGPRSPEDIYNTSCMGCHASGAAGAPKMGDADAWGKRLANLGSEEALWKSGWKGVNAMPPKGMCMDCSEEEFAGVVGYILKNSQ